jgi:hypothetical protein
MRVSGGGARRWHTGWHNCVVAVMTATIVHEWMLSSCGCENTALTNCRMIMESHAGLYLMLW